MFYHPLMDNLAGLSDQQLEKQLTELVKKYTIAQSMGNAGLQQQLSGIIQHYRDEVVNRTNARYAKYSEQKNKNEPDPFSVIDIT